MIMEDILDNEVGVEDRLTVEVDSLWAEHVRIAGAKKASAAELRALRAQLAARLFEMKQLLSRPGRGGGWRSWLSTVGIPRTTGDRTVERHGESLGETAKNVPTGASSPADEVERLVQSLMPRLRRSLTSKDAACRFAFAVIKEFDLYYETVDDGILLLQPDSEEKPIPVSEPLCQQDGAAKMVETPRYLTGVKIAPPYRG
jgi:hypothetical protein